MGAYKNISLNIEIITSFSEEYYNKIGKDSVESWVENWPDDMNLNCYVEGNFEIIDHPRVKRISFDITEYPKFLERGKIGGQERKFAKKAFSFIHSMQTTAADRIIWLDADVITTDQLTRPFIEAVLPNDVLSTHMGVTYYEKKDGTPGRWYVPETGFFAVNTRHPKFSNFRDEYRRRYLEHDQTNLRRFYDNDVYGYVLEELNTETLDLCKDFGKPYKTPLRHTVLGPYLHHYKAKGAKADYINED
jgi:hypothetical protein